MNRGRGAARGGRAGSAAGSGPPGTDPAAPSSTTNNTSTPTPIRGRGGTRRPTGAANLARFRPKNIRRSSAERERLNQEEERKARIREAEERRELKVRGRGRGSRRSRGDAMGARGRGRGGFGSASGPFSSGTYSLSKGGGGGSGWFGGGGGGGSSGGGFRIGGSGSRGPKSEAGFRQGSSHDRETRINADKMHALTIDDELDSDDEAGIEALGTQPANSIPMGIFRRKHQEAEVVVATTAELEAAENATGEEESLWVDGDGRSSSSTPGKAIPDQPPEEGVWGKADVKVKKEPEDESVMDLDSVEEEEAKTKKKNKVEIKVKKAAPLDPEDSLARKDLDLLASELGTVTIGPGDDEKETKEASAKDGRMYLFQFPPLLPPLKAIPPGSKLANRASGIKGEPRELSMADAVDLTQVNDASKPEGEAADADDDDDEEDRKDDPEATKGFMSSLMSQGGMIGQLKVRKSGKVELDWGGRTLEMRPSTSMGFLSTAVILEENDEKPHPETIGGESIGMGKIMGRFVLAPTWDEEEDWDVRSEDLKIPEDAE